MLQSFVSTFVSTATLIIGIYFSLFFIVFEPQAYRQRLVYRRSADTYRLPVGEPNVQRIRDLLKDERTRAFQTPQSTSPRAELL